MNILLTGVAGFIASKVAEFLLEEGHTVVGVDNMNGAYDVRLKEWRLARLLEYPNFSFHRLDVADLGALRKLFESISAEDGRPMTEDRFPASRFTLHDLRFTFPASRFDAIINLAARAGVRQSVENPWVYCETNVTGTLNLLELAREYGIKSFILASTSSLYGKHNPMPYREDADTSGPLSPYAASKKAAETLCYTYHYLYGINVVVLRYFTVYGPAGRPDMSLFRFVQWIMEGRPVVVYGDGSQSRDFTYVDDIARGTIAAMNYLTSISRPQSSVPGHPLGEASPVPGPSSPVSCPPSPVYEIINLGSDTPVVLIDAIKLVEEFTGRKARLEFRPMHPADVPATWADITRAGEILGWRPGYSFEEGVKNLVEWYKENRQWAKEIDTGP